MVAVLVALLLPYRSTAPSAAPSGVNGRLQVQTPTESTGGGSLLDKRSGFALLVVLIVMWYATVKLDVPLRSLRASAPPYSWPIATLGTGQEWKDEADLKAIRAVLSARRGSERSAVDWEATIRASIGRLGWPELRRKTILRPVEYLFLIERRSSEDHLARFYTEVLSEVRTSADVDFCYYDGTPQTCYINEPARQISLETLARHHPNAAVVILGAASTLIDPVAGGMENWSEVLRTWKYRAALLTEHPTEFELRSLITSGLLSVGFGGLEELTAMTSAIDFSPANISLKESKSEREVTTISGLQERLGRDLFQWMCACALHHEIAWPITIALSTVPELLPTRPNATQMFELFRLPWFRSGNMPNGLRSELIKAMPVSSAVAAHKTIVESLQKSPAPGVSYAALARELDLRAHDRALSALSRSDSGRGGSRLITGNESILDIFAPRSLVRAPRPSSNLRNTIDQMIALVVGTAAFVLRDYGEDEPLVFLLFLAYTVCFAYAVISLVA